jgi:hypothetical protein
MLDPSIKRVLMAHLNNNVRTVNTYRVGIMYAAEAGNARRVNEFMTDVLVDAQSLRDFIVQLLADE